MRFAFVDAEKANHTVARLCRHLEVTRAGYYAWCKREMSERERRRRELEARVEDIFDASHQTYGSPRVLAELRDEGERVSKRTVENIMKRKGLRARVRRAFRRTTQRDDTRAVVPNRLDRNFTASRPNEKWASDITYIWTAAGWQYLAVTMDLFSRKVVGWAVSRGLKTTVVLEALHMARLRRDTADALMHHSDQGIQYTSYAFEEMARDAGIDELSMSRKGECWDNAVVESFFSTLKEEFLHRHAWRDAADLKTGLFQYIEIFYNRQRRHSTLSYKSPAQHEENYYAAEAA